MKRTAARRRLGRDGALTLLAMVLPPLLIPAFWPAAWQIDLPAMPLFMLGLLSLFASLPCFTRYKHALIATERAFDCAEEPAAWARLRRTRTQALVVAALPAWIGAFGTPLEPVARLLLLSGSLVLWCCTGSPQLR